MLCCPHGNPSHPSAYLVLPVLFPQSPSSFLALIQKVEMLSLPSELYLLLTISGTHFLVFSFLRQHLKFSSYSSGGLWTSNSPAFTSQVLVLEARAMTPRLYSAGDQAQGFVQANITLLPTELHSPLSEWLCSLSLVLHPFLPPLTSILASGVTFSFKLLLVQVRSLSHNFYSNLNLSLTPLVTPY